MGALSRLPWWRRPGRRDREVALDALRRGRPRRDLAGETFGKLSGGQRQRVLIARSLVQDARVLLLDEPFSGLDRPSSERLEALIETLAAEGRGVVIATHDLEQARRWDTVLCLNRAQIAVGPPGRGARPGRPRGDLRRRDRRAAGTGRSGDPAAPPPSPLRMLEPLHDEFMRRAIVEIALIGAAGGALGCWVVLYRLSYAAESLAHSIFPGLVLASLAGVPLLLGGAPAIVLAALAIAAVSRVPGVSRDVAVGVVVTTLFGLGALLALSPSAPPGLQGLLFGDILGPCDADLLAAAPSSPWSRSASGCCTVACWRAASTAPPRARSAPPRRLPKRSLMVLLAAAIVVAVQGLGNLLVVAVFVGPAAAARNLTERIVPMIALAVGDRAARRPRRPLPLLLRRHGRRRLGRAGDRRRLPPLAAGRHGRPPGGRSRRRRREATIG